MRGLSLVTGGCKGGGEMVYLTNVTCTVALRRV